MNADGSNKVQLTNTTLKDTLPRWSPDGSKIAFTRCGINISTCDIFTMNADGSTQINLTSTNPNYDDNPRWTPDGSKIVYDTYMPSNYNVCESIVEN